MSDGKYSSSIIKEKVKRRLLKAIESNFIR